MTQCKPLPPVALLRELFDYDPATGVLTNKVRRSTRLPGTRAGTRRPDGYWLIGVNKKMYLLHRVAWAVHFGAEPEGFLDHRDRNPSNNSLNNLRVSDYSKNAANVLSKRKFPGVTWDKGKWTAKFRTNYLGRFDTEKEGSTAYVAAHLAYFGRHSIYAEH